MPNVAFFKCDSVDLKFLKVNGRKVYVRRIDSLEQGEHSHEWLGKARGTDFKIVGGKADRANEWFVQLDILRDIVIRATSFTACIKLIETA